MKDFLAKAARGDLPNVEIVKAFSSASPHGNYAAAVSETLAMPLEPAQMRQRLLALGEERGKNWGEKACHEAIETLLRGERCDY